MIKNERQYRIATAEAARFSEALASRPNAPPENSDIHPRFWDAETEAMHAQLEELRAELSAYDALQSGTHRLFDVRGWQDVPRALVQGRIAMGLTQKDLAERLELPEQTIQRYEATEYAAASLSRLRDIATALGLELSGFLIAPDAEPTPSRFFARLKEIGLDRRIVSENLLPPALASAMLTPAKAGAKIYGAVMQAAGLVERIFGIPPSVLFGNEPLTAFVVPATAARFKRPKVRTKANVDRQAITDGYTFFVHYLALLVLETTSHLPREPVPESPQEWRSRILRQFGSLEFEHVVQFFWSVGIPILPLRDSGIFHGACWRIGGREVIVLKQRTLSEDRWTLDVLHEGGHIVQEPLSESFQILEDETPSFDDPREQNATRFASEILLDGKADALAERAVNLANNNVRFLERAVRRIADEASVPLGVLANYLAYRIAADTRDASEPINWWPSAARLQRQRNDPWKIARDALLEHADFARLNPIDRDLLVRALMDPTVEPAAKGGTNT